MLHAVITEYRGCLVFQLVARRADVSSYLATSIDDPGLRVQRVVEPSANLGVSQQAYDLLCNVLPGADADGSFGWKRELGQLEQFSWSGGLLRCALPHELHRPLHFIVGGFRLVANRCSDLGRRSVDIKLACRA
jgi:hypothetical protein